MRFKWLGLIELFVVLLFAVGWGVLELVVLRLDRRRTEGQPSLGHDEEQSACKSRHAERQ